MKRRSAYVSKLAAAVAKKKKKTLASLVDKEKNDAIVAKATARKATTHKGRKILEAREGSIHEPAKNCLFLKGTTCKEPVRTFLNDICVIRKPYSLSLSGKQQDLDLFRSSEPLDFLCEKNESSIFCYGHTNKQRPNRFIAGRTFDNHVMDMYELHLRDYVPLSEFRKNVQPIWGSKPVVLATGAEFESSDHMKYLRNFLIDFFGCAKLDKLSLTGVDQLITLTAVANDNSAVAKNAAAVSIYFRRYSVTHKKTAGSPEVELNEIGPRFYMVPERSKLPERDVWKAAVKLPKELKGTKVKNVTTNVLGETHGRVHVGVQDLTKLYTPHHHGKK